MDILKSRYPYFNLIKKRFPPRFRFFAYYTLSKKRNLRQAYLSLSKEEFQKLGFAGIPTYKVLRQFIYERISLERFPMVFYWVVKELVFLLRKHGIDLGRQTFQDATDIRALKHDDEAHYSGYYKESGNKLDVTIDAERDVPLHYITLEITDDEGKNLIPSQEHLTSLGIQTKEHIVHDKYATYENIARSETHGTTMIYTIAKNWCITPVVPLMVLNSCIRGITRRMILSLVLILSSCCITCARKVKLRLSELSLGISGWLKQRRTQKDMNRNAMNEEAAWKDSSVG